MKKIALIGAGAIGTVYARHLHDEYANNFAVVAAGARAERLRQSGITLNETSFFPRVISPQEPDFTADLILVCVKNYHLSQAIKEIRGLVGEHTVILPVLNGITARDLILAAYPQNHVLYGLALYIDAIRTPDGVINTNDGIIQLGNADNTTPAPEVQAVSDCLTEAGIGIQVCPDMIRTIWKKWMLNVGCNQVTAITRTNFNRLTTIPESQSLFHDAMMEVVSLAAAAGVSLTQEDALEFEELMKTFSPQGKTSMLQDVEAGRITEVDSFGGTVIELGRQFGVPTPVNDVLYRIIKSIEQMY
ncbi:MAG: ketopantoate reductase family protein [Acetanaerobacterium sp.]